jgi:hypothetical protein
LNERKRHPGLVTGFVRSIANLRKSLRKWRRTGNRKRTYCSGSRVAVSSCAHFHASGRKGQSGTVNLLDVALGQQLLCISAWSVLLANVSVG